ncbi:hypothetical protein [Pantoea sp. C2G6]|uniref:hypothetical protein n=1 Tax=Pantoea sp. C2G6 TaxID=3243084 RepID=UPI003EDB61DF
MYSLKKFLAGFFSSSAVVGFAFIYYYCYHIINYAPDGLSFGNSLAILAIVLRLFIPVSIGVILINYAFLISDLRQIKKKAATKNSVFFVFFIVAFLVVLYVNYFLNKDHVINNSSLSFLGQGVLLTLVSASFWLIFVYFPVSRLGKNALLPSAPSTSVHTYTIYKAFNFLAALLLFFLFYFIAYTCLGWFGLNNFVKNSMEMAGFRKTNIEILLKKDSEEIIELSCRSCDRELSGLTTLNKDSKEREFTATLKQVDILWGTGDKHFIRFCNNNGEYVYAELPKDGYNMRGQSRHLARGMRTESCLKADKENKQTEPPLVEPPSDTPKKVVDAPAGERQPTIVINNYNVPVQAISGLIPEQPKVTPPAKKPPKLPVYQCPEVSPHH